MIRSLSTAATGMEAQQTNIERISNDISNVDTDGFKRSRTEFQDLMYQNTREPGSELGASTRTPVGIQTGMGVKVGSNYKIQEQGPAKMTNVMLDFMIEGPGFLQVQRPSGEIAYTRAGKFHTDAEGRIMNSNGDLLMPQITIPKGSEIKVNQRGEVTAQVPGQPGETTLGQIQIHRFTNEEGLSALGGNLVKPTPASGAAMANIPGDPGVGFITQGALEASNVNIATSMVDMIKAQRAYELNGKVLTTADKMLEATINLK